MGVPLNPLARDLLESLGVHSASSELEVGGGICLWYYSPHRTTNDLDLWWASPSYEAETAIEAAVQEVSARQLLTLSRRVQTSYRSWDLRQGPDIVFAVQIALKSNSLEPPIPSPWGALMLETLAENLANKMAALVQRGAPRDFVDIAEMLKTGKLTIPLCWEYWQAKNPNFALDLAKAQLTRSLEALEMRRPLERIDSVTQRESAQATRAWIRQLLVS